MPFRWKDDASLRLSEIVWREDMASFVLELLRRGIVRDLRYLASRPAAYVVSCKDSQHLSAHKQVAAILWLGVDRDASAQKFVCNGATDDHGRVLPSYAMYEHEGQYIPYFNMIELLGPKYLNAVRRASPTQFASKVTVIKRKRPTVKLQLKLWKLMGYLGSTAGMVSNYDIIEEEVYGPYGARGSISINRSRITSHSKRDEHRDMTGNLKDSKSLQTAKCIVLSQQVATKDLGRRLR